MPAFFLNFFLKLITYMWSHERDKVRQRQSVWIQGSGQLVVRPTQNQNSAKRNSAKTKQCYEIVQNETVRDETVLKRNSAKQNSATR